MTTVITFGTFDLFHIGHLNLLQRARHLGDRLVVGVSTDALNYWKKGRYPIFPEQERLAIVRALKCVDDVFLEESLEQKADYVQAHSADVLVMGADWEGKFDHLKGMCRVVYLPRTEEISTTEVEQFIQTRVPDEPVRLRSIET